MPFIMPEVAVRLLIDHGIKELRKNRGAFDDLFAQLVDPGFVEEYGPAYREQIWEWFSITKLPVIEAWAFNAQKIPCISIHLANETEDESKAAMDDLAGVGKDANLGTAVFTTMVDIGIHTARSGGQVLWLYYIVSYILFRYKPLAESWGLKLQTYSASAYSKDADKAATNVWTRWVRFRCTTQNFWDADPLRKFDHIRTYPRIGLPPSEDIATSLDVDLKKVDRTANKGVLAELPTSNEGYETFIDGDSDEDLS